ncbi:putative fused transcriptional regulator/phosphomethylpyrimidine kinase [Limibacillus sp. MBR-115]
MNPRCKKNFAQTSNRMIDSVNSRFAGVLHKPAGRGDLVAVHGRIHEVRGPPRL